MDLKYRIALTSSFVFFRKHSRKTNTPPAANSAGFRLAALTAAFALTSFSLFAAAARLRIDNTTFGPLSVAVGSNGPTQTVNAVNAGDTQLNLSATSSVTWLVPTVPSLQACGLLGRCIPISIALNTASLAKGTYTGIVTLSDPNAIDAPQRITVTVNVGGGVPDSITLYVPANGSAVTQSFYLGGKLTPTLNQPTDGPVMSVTVPGSVNSSGSYPYTLTASTGTGVAEKSYSGSMVIAGSPVSNENKTVPVTLNVTSQPIATASPANVSFRMSTAAAAQTQYVAVTNPSGGTLALSGATATATQGGTWLSAAVAAPYVTITADPTGLQVGSYQGSVAIASNAANTTVTIPVTFDVVASAAPFAKAGAVVNNATFESDTLALGDFPALFGEQLTNQAPFVATNAPYPTTAAGATVYINDQAVPLYYVSEKQINFLIPYETKTGDATLRVDRDGQRGNTVSIKIASASPKLLLAASSAGVVSGAVAGALATVHRGDVLVLYGFGFGPTSPAVPTNTATPASPYSLVPGTNLVYFGAGGLLSSPVSAPLLFAGLAPTFISAFYQINIQIPTDAPLGTAVPMFIQGDVGTTNKLLLNIQ